MWGKKMSRKYESTKEKRIPIRRLPKMTKKIYDLEKIMNDLTFKGIKWDRKLLNQLCEITSLAPKRLKNNIVLLCMILKNSELKEK